MDNAFVVHIKILPWQLRGRQTELIYNATVTDSRIRLLSAFHSALLSHVSTFGFDTMFCQYSGETMIKGKWPTANVLIFIASDHILINWYSDSRIQRLNTANTLGMMMA